MKLLKLFPLLCIFGLCSLVAQGQETKAWDWPALSATGYTTNLNLMNHMSAGQSWVVAHQMFSVSLGTGTNSVCTWQVQASDDLGTTWYNVGTANSCTAATYYNPIEVPLRFVRIQVVSYTGTAAVTFHWTGGF